MGGCFPRFGSSSEEGNSNDVNNGAREVVRRESSQENPAARSNLHANRESSARDSGDSKKEAGIPEESTSHSAAQRFTFRELAAATNNFGVDCLIGEGGFGEVYKGKLESTSQVVAVKKLDQNSLQGNREFLMEVRLLNMLHHPNLVSLIGYCSDGDQRLLVYEYMPLGSLEDHLHDVPPDKKPLDWNTRMKIAADAAKGLEYLHETNPPVIFRDLKSSNILLDDGYFPKLSDFGLAKLGPVGDKTHVSTRVMGTYGYCDPEYAMTGQLTLRSDIYSFGVVFLELITGRKAIDYDRSSAERNLVEWARPLFKNQSNFRSMADPLLQGHYPIRGLQQALAVAAMCLHVQAASRPLIGEVVTALTSLASQTYDPNAPSSQHYNNPTHRNEQKSASDGMDRLDDARREGHHGSPSVHEKSPDSRRGDSTSEFNSSGELQRTETGGGSGSKSGLDQSERPDSQRDSPASVGRTGESLRNRDIDREREVALAKVWAENFRDRKGFDGTNE